VDTLLLHLRDALAERRAASIAAMEAYIAHPSDANRKAVRAAHYAEEGAARALSLHVISNLP
jgi:hypothetical protein